MKRLVFALSLAAWMTCLFADELPDLTTFKPLPKASMEPVFIENFDSGMDGWSNSTKNFSWRAGEGMTGTGCVMAERKESKESVYSYRDLKLEHGMYYRLTIHYRTEMVKDPELTKQELFKKLSTAIHQFAKRQMTWFRGMERSGVQIHWVQV